MTRKMGNVWGSLKKFDPIRFEYVFFSYSMHVYIFRIHLRTFRMYVHIHGRLLFFVTRKYKSFVIFFSERES